MNKESRPIGKEFNILPDERYYEELMNAIYVKTLYWNPSDRRVNEHTLH